MSDAKHALKTASEIVEARLALLESKDDVCTRVQHDLEQRLAAIEEWCRCGKGDPCKIHDRWSPKVEPAPASPGSWKAREGGFPSPWAERRPEAREWWYCNGCGQVYKEKPEIDRCDRGWSRVLEIERIEP